MDRTSLAGYAAVTGEPLVIDDAYFLPPDVEYTINRSFDERYGYRTKSMLVIPMKDHKEQVIGVLQLINRKRSLDAVLATPAAVEQQVVPFSKRTVELVTALAGQAAVAIENSQLYREIERLFDGFVWAGGGARHRAARSDHVRSLGAGREHDSEPGGGGGQSRGRALSRPHVHARAAARDPLRRLAARLRQGRGAGAGPRQSEEALSPAARADPPAARLRAAQCGAGVLAQTRGIPGNARAPGVRAVRAHP